MDKKLSILLVCMVVLGTMGVTMAIPSQNNPQNIQISKTADKYSGMVGDTVTFTVKISNPNTDNGMNNFQDVVLVDTIPAGLEIVSTNVGTINSQTVTYNAGTLLPGEERTLTITVKATTPGKYNNTAEVTYKVNEGTPAWNETVVDVPGHYEYQKVEADHNGWTLNSAKQVQQKPGNQPINAQFFSIGTIKNGYKVVDDVGEGVNKIWQPVMECKKVWVDTTYKTIEHPEVPNWVERTAKVVLDPEITIEKPSEPVTPVTPVTPVEPVNNVTTEKTVPMETTGGFAGYLLLAIGLVMAGTGISKWNK